MPSQSENEPEAKTCAGHIHGAIQFAYFPGERFGHMLASSSIDDAERLAYHAIMAGAEQIIGTELLIEMN